MYKLDYMKKQIEHNDLIWIDTCTMMYTERFEIFIKNARSLLLENNKKIIVPDCVMAELAKHQCSEDETRRICASAAIEIIRCNSDIFKVEYIENDASNGENFADPKILTVILENRRNLNQLLISNDQRLTSDANKFNYLESFNGSRISVCYIGYNGEMNICDCVKNARTSKPSEKIIYKDRIIEKEVIKDVKSDKTFIEKHGFELGLASGVFGSVTICNWHKIAKLCKSMFK